MKDFVENLIADLPGSSVFNQRQREPLTQNWKMTQPEEPERRVRHSIDVRPDAFRIVVGARPIRARYQNHERFGHENQNTPYGRGSR